MGSDLVVALKEASANGTTLFGLNHHAAPAQRHALQMVQGQMHEPGAVIPIADLALPQARQTFAVLGVQPIGQWGFAHGVNEHRVAVGVTDWKSRLTGDPAALGGFDMVRLALERGRGALGAVEILTDLHERHGGADRIYLIAGAEEAFVLEACGRSWALLECGHTRVVTDAAMIRQDWRRLAPGLASSVIEQGWWRDDGSKIDFVGCLADHAGQSQSAQKRWGHASLALAQQQGAIDLHFLRRLLADHYVANRDRFLFNKTTTLATSFLVDLHKAEQPIVAWISFGTPKVAVHFPICLAGELPAVFSEGLPGATTIQERTQDLQKLAQGKDGGKLTAALERLQSKFDQDAEDFMVRAQSCLHQAKPYLVPQLATEMMHQHVDLFDKEYRRLFGVEEKAPHQVPATEEVLFFA